MSIYTKMSRGILSGGDIVRILEPVSTILASMICVLAGYVSYRQKIGLQEQFVSRFLIKKS